MRRRQLVLALPLLVLGCGLGPQSFSVPPESTILVVRHSDRDGPDLNAKGIARSEALVEAVSDFDLKVILSPGIQRNLDTAAPLSEARALPITRSPGETPTGPLLRAAQGSAAIWVGNKGNIRQIWTDLSLPDPAPLEYGDLAVIRSDAQGRVTVEMRRFGP